MEPKVQAHRRLAESCDDQALALHERYATGGTAALLRAAATIVPVHHETAMLKSM